MSFQKKGQSNDYLEALTGAIKRKKFITIDIESKDGDSQKPGFTRPFLVGLYDPQDSEYQQFSDEPHLKSRDWKRRHIQPGGCIDKLLSVALTRKYHAHLFYAHNGGGFDHLFLLAWLREHLNEFGFEVIPVQSSIQVIRVWRLPEGPEDPIRERWEFLDSMKLIPMGLERACKTFGLPGKVEHDLAMHEDDPRWGVYLKQDCIALATVLALFFDMVEHKLGGEVGMTAPSTSMKLFRRRFLGRDGTPSKIARFAHWVDCKTKNHATSPCEGCAHQWIRLGYYGGRTELFKAYGERLHYYDINSSYVAAMQEDMPIGDRTVSDTLDWRMADKHGGFVECTVYIPPECKIPPLPHRDVKTGKLLFPAGHFHGVWTTAELKLLEDPMVNGRIESVSRVVWFRKKPLFKFMVNELWRLRDKNEPGFDEGLSALAKLMGNSLYGKFGMRQERTSVVFAQNVDEGKCFLCRGPCERIGGFCGDCEGSKPAMSDIDGDVWYQHKRVEAAYIIPHIAAWITSLARVRIWNYMKAALEAGGELYYVDTDSVITDVVLPSTTELGGLKDEYPVSQAKKPEEAFGFESPEQATFWLEAMTLTGTFVQPKVYMLESHRFDQPKVTMKGFPYRNNDSQHEKKCTCPECVIRCKENLIKLRAGETLSWRQLEKVRSLARDGFRNPPQMRNVSKSFKTKYSKRQLAADGSTTSIVLDERAFNFAGTSDERDAAE